MKYLAFFLLVQMGIFGQTQVLHQLVYEIRDPNTDASRFRHCVERIGEYLALDVMEELKKEEKSIVTLNGVEAKHMLVDEVPVIVTILRAGLPLVNGIHRVFPHAEVGFISMSRDEETLKAKVEYLALPEMKGRTVIMADTMLATGGSMLDAIRLVQPYEPKRIVVISAIAAQCGLKRIGKFAPAIKVFAAVVDPELNEKGYIVPGLGDAGDRSYGKKHFIQ